MIFDISLGLLLIFTGLLKIIFFQYTHSTIKKLEIFPSNSTFLISIGMPLFELIQGFLLLIYNNVITYCLIVGYLLFFIALNIKTYIGKDNKECCCYGKLIKSKLGLGGFLHYTYWLIILIFAIICYKNNYFIIQDISDFKIWYTIILIIINGFIIRSLVEKIM